MLDDLWREVRLGARRLASARVFFVFTVISLAIGLSVTTTAYSILYALFWKPVAVQDAGRLVVVTTPWSAPRWILAMSKPDFDDLRASQQSFSAIAASASIGQSVVTDTRSEIAMVEAVTGDYFSTLGLAPALGRLLQPADAERQVAVLSHLLWRTRFHADPQVVGQIVRVGGRPFEIVGVAPRAFDGLRRPPQRTVLWLPPGAADYFTSGGGRPEREQQRLVVVGRLAAGRSAEQATSEVFAIASGLDATAPIHNENARTPDRRIQRQWRTMPIQQALAPRDTRVGLLLLGLVALVLVVACANLANLMLARGTARLQEIAVRRALGASRWRLIRELLVESAFVAALGGALGLVLTRTLLVFGTVEIPIGHGSVILDVALNRPALAAAAGAILLSLLVFGLAPAVSLTRKNVAVDLAAPSGNVGTAPSRRQRTLITGQVAISTCFLLVAAILGRIILAGATHDPGIALDRLALTTVHFSLLGWDEPRARRALDRAVDIARRQPGIEAVAVSSGMPFGRIPTQSAEITTPDNPFVESRIRGLNQTAAFLPATPQIFHTLQVPIVRGRAFDERDDAGAPKVAVISERAARVLFGTPDVVGRQLLLRLSSKEPPGALTIVGVSRDTDVHRYMERREGAVFVPLAQRYAPNLVVSARTPGDPASAVGVLQDSLRQADPDLSTGNASTAETLLAGEVVAARLAGSLAAALAFVMLTLAMVGLYGIQMHAVAGRTREVGVRMALGATVRQIQSLVLREGYRPVFVGVESGLCSGSSRDWDSGPLSWRGSKCSIPSPRRSSRSRSSPPRFSRAGFPPGAQRASIRTWRYATCSFPAHQKIEI